MKTALIISVLVFLSASSCKRENICPCGTGYKQQEYQNILYVTSIPIHNNEKYIIQTQAEYETIFQQNVQNGFILPTIDFNNKTLLGGHVHYEDQSNFGTKLFLCFNKKKKNYIYKIYARKRNTLEMYYPKMYWRLADKISSDYNIEIEIIKK